MKQHKKSTLLQLLINGLIACLRPLVGPPGVCRFEFPCTDYARMMLKDEPLLKAIILITRRVIACNPFVH